MAAQKPVQEAIDGFLADNRNLAGSRDGFPALALNLSRVRELAEYVDGLHKQIESLKNYILYKNPICQDAEYPMTEYCDMMHVCDECQARLKAVKRIEEITE